MKTRFRPLRFRFPRLTPPYIIRRDQTPLIIEPHRATPLASVRAESFQVLNHLGALDEAGSAVGEALDHNGAVGGYRGEEQDCLSDGFLLGWLLVFGFLGGGEGGEEYVSERWIFRGSMAWKAFSHPRPTYSSVHVALLWQSVLLMSMDVFRGSHFGGRAVFFLARKGGPSSRDVVLGVVVGMASVNYGCSHGECEDCGVIHLG